jgi:cysteinyl-tRNA synthetase
LIFPHHENEIAQTESLVGPPMANVWMHGGLLQFDGRKMSKSLGNFEPLHDLLDRHDPQAIRFLFLQTGYRKPMNFTEASIEGATTGLRRLQSAYDDLRTAPAAGHDEASVRASLVPYETRFFEALDDDMNTSGAVSVLFDLASAATDLIVAGAASRAAAFLHEAMTLVGISPVERGTSAARSTVERSRVVELSTGANAKAGATFTITRKGDAPLGDRALEDLRALLGEIVPPPPIDSEDAVDAVVEARLLAKSEKDFALADRLREALAAIGVVVNDAKDGATWTVGV